MLERFMTALDCVDTAFISDGTLDQLPLPSRVGKTRVGGIDINRPRTRAALAAVLALASSPAGFTVADLARKVRAMTGQPLRGCKSTTSGFWALPVKCASGVEWQHDGDGEGRPRRGGSPRVPVRAVQAR